MKKKIVLLISIWVIYIVSDYFVLPYFIQPFAWLIVCITFLILTFKQIIKVIKERKNLNLKRILNLLVSFVLFILTFYNFNQIPQSIIEKIDWEISYNKRNQIVNKVKTGEFKSNTKMNNGICELPFDFPMVSNGGNDIWILNYKNGKLIHFWISRGLLESPQTYFIYTENVALKKRYEELIIKYPKSNWQLEENWYRITE
jgi:hypothetical protein